MPRGGECGMFGSSIPARFPIKTAGPTMTPHSISRRQLIQAAAVGLGALASPLLRAAESEKASGGRARRSVSLAGAEFGTQRKDFSQANPGRYDDAYIYNGLATIKYFVDQGFPLLRIPFRWERMQPRLGEEFDREELERMVQTADWVRQAGGTMIVDMHNFGRYVIDHKGRPRDTIIDEPVDGAAPVTREHFVDFWLRASKALKDHPAIEMYGLMCEPHDMGRSDWKAISQAAVAALRKAGDGKHLLVSGDDWSHAHNWAENHGPTGWIRDPADNFSYEAHCYFDHDTSGTYKWTYARELAKDSELESRGARTLQHFVDWCQTNGVRGFLGEFGVPVADEDWLRCTAKFLETLDRAGMIGCWWAAGEWWGKYKMSIQPKKKDPPTPALKLLVERRP
jgi:endoglucanase